jgi:hypothetical protein
MSVKVYNTDDKYKQFPGSSGPVTVSKEKARSDTSRRIGNTY